LVAGVIQINVRIPAQLPDFVLSAGSSGIFVAVGDGLLSSVLATVAVK
jgi:hypothetical protein